MTLLMLSFRSMRFMSLALALLLMAGCAWFKSGAQDSASDSHKDPYAQSDFDELLGFGADMAVLPAVSRTELCRSLLNRQAPGPGVQLHLMMGRVLSDACGDIPKILEGLDSPAVKNLSDERVRRLVAVQTEALRRINSLSKKMGLLERKYKIAQTAHESKKHKGSKDPKVSNKDESRLLRDKLEAIRDMERKLDETGDGN